MKKRMLVLLAALLMLLTCGCGRSLNSVIKREPHFSGTVLEVRENAVLVEADEGEDIRRSGDLAWVSLDAEYPDGISAYAVGDRVTVYYDGCAAESYPLQIPKVYAVLLIDQADRNDEAVG